MEDTIAVALITASSTLLGGALAAFIAARTTGRQLDSQERQAQQDRSEQRGSRRRELRREAYMQFLNELDSLNRKLAAAWSAPAPSEGNAIIGQFRDTTWQLRERSNLIALEGPKSVAIAAEAAVRSALDQVHSLDQVAAIAAHLGSRDVLLELREDEWETHSDRCRRAHQDFLDRARAAMGADLPGDG